MLNVSSALLLEATVPYFTGNDCFDRLFALYELLSIDSELSPIVNVAPPVVFTVATIPSKLNADASVPYLFFAVGCVVTEILDTVSLTTIVMSAVFPSYASVIV